MTPVLETGRLLVDGLPDLAAHVERHGSLPAHRSGRELLAAIEAAGLTGRGGAGFPTYRKWTAVANAGATSGKRPVVIGNGAEGEPASRKDRALLRTAPHLVLDGLQIAALAVGAGQAHLYVPGREAVALRSIVAQRRDDLPVTVHEAPDAFIAGEESAVVAAMSGRVPVPADKLRRVTDFGVGGAPTLVQNVETLAHAALIARHGPDWFRRRGTPAEPGTFLATVGGPVAAPGVYELGYGEPLGDLIAAAGGTTVAVQAVLVGGYHGAWVPALADLPLSREALSAYGASPGAGVVVPLPSAACGLVETSRIASYLAGQTAGQCGPCVNGLPRLADTLAALAGRSRGPGLPAEVDRLAAIVTNRGACRHPDGTGRLIHSALRYFARDVNAHLAGACLADAQR